MCNLKVNLTIYDEQVNQLQYYQSHEDFTVEKIDLIINQKEHDDNNEN